MCCLLCATLGLGTARPNGERLIVLGLGLRVGDGGERLGSFLDAFDERGDGGLVEDVKGCATEENRHRADNVGGGLVDPAEELALEKT